MDIDFALILVVITAVCFVIYLVDKFFLGTERAEAIKALKEQYPNWMVESEEDYKAYRLQFGQLGPEPVVIEYAKSFLPVFAIVLVLRSFLFEPFQIPSGSMIPTLKIGDFILVNKFNYGLRLPVIGTKVLPIGEPERGDVMVFYPPNDSRYFIKRIIGLPGDHIKIVNKVLYVNGVRADQTQIEQETNNGLTARIFSENLGGVEHLIRTESRRTRGDNLSVVVKPGHYFMMGDNRDNSSDSRFWGQVPSHNIVGEAVAVWMTWESFFSLPKFSRVGTIE